ncbi:SRPBCC domain-containing protein [Actinomycetospora termitidis]|uniref:SRPBCC domain-containing protein n=1 Tax=Actinomycetospora termitidis TaxID=3053470 RepID=A0ABT7MCU5_9PSEU|nr:SRPBCC domain-containing protein [Actinomycetospora sp. Odt1-22]MDL5158491.1 SRPBCC domain-containing protein [Actinomycetospora sp. Odt1-22]
MTTGTYLEIDSRPALRWVREYPDTVERVWAAISDPTELTAWFPARVSFPDDGVPRVGRPVTFSFTEDGDGGTGTVLAAEPPSRLVFTWEGDELRFEVTPLKAGSRLTFTTIIAEPDTAARTAAGWEVCLEALDGALSGVGAEAPSSSPTPAWKRHFDDYVAAGVPWGAPIPD